MDDQDRHYDQQETRPSVQGPNNSRDVLSSLPVATGVWIEDNRLGINYAETVVTFIRREGCPNLLGHVVKNMMAQGAYGGVEVGFFHRLAELSVRPE